MRMRGPFLGAALAAALLAFSVSTASGFEGDEEEGAESASSAPALWKILQEEQPSPAPTVIGEIKHDTSIPLRKIKPLTSMSTPEAPENPARKAAPVNMPDFFDPVVQTTEPKSAMQPPIASFNGVPFGNGCSCAPPDTNGEAGLTQYVQTVNVAFAVYSKTGTTLMAPVPINTVFSGFGGLCETTNNGDPVVQYDQVANRWVVTQFAFTGNGETGTVQCVAVSTTSDATGAYNRYAFQISANQLNDYPKLGVWPDGYYVSTNDFRWTGQWNYDGASAIVFDRDKMLLGQAATGIRFTLGPAFWSLLPSDLDGSMLPPAGAPNAFVQVDDNTWGYPQDQLEVWKLHADWVTPASSTFTHDGDLGTASFNLLGANVPQPGTSQKLDTLGDRLMYRLDYRNFGDHEALVVNHSVNAATPPTNRSGVRWYELRRTGGNWSIFQQGTFGPADGLWRWMGSVAMDKFGNMAGGWSTSSGSAFPSINYGGRLSTDPVGQLNYESVLHTGGGSQTSPDRWGDYSATSVDPADDCTFWYTTEYYSSSTSWTWKTRIAAFRFPQCGGGGGGPTITGFTPTSGPRGTVVTINGTNFTGATSVKFNGTSASFNVIGPTQIITSVPTGATTGPISVTSPQGIAVSATNFTVTSAGGPTITSFTPTSGPVGTIVTVNGTGFSGVTAVKFNGASATQYQVSSPTKLFALVPSGATTGPISVTTPAGTGTSAASFTVTGGGGGPPSISSFAPTSGPVGTVVTINGSGFTGVTAVKFNGASAQFLVASSTKLYAKVPPGATTGKITVTNGSGTGTSANNFNVT